MPQSKREHVDAHELRTLLEQAPDAYFLHDFSGRIIDVNRRACESLGYSREELLQLSVFDVESNFDPAAAEKVWSSMVPGEGTTLAGKHRRKDGSVSSGGSAGQCLASSARKGSTWAWCVT